MIRFAIACLICGCLALLSTVTPALADEPAANAPLHSQVHSQAHAHNDYLHERPLLDALDNGFCSVEADIFLIDGQLLVAHDLFRTSTERTLRGLYLDPLQKRIRRNGGSVHGDGKTITLLIDIKSAAESTYRALHRELARYQEILTHVDRDGVHQGAVTVIISGNRAFQAIESDLPRYAGIDGRLSDLDSDRPPALMPLISDHWGRNFAWRGEGEMSQADREKLTRIIQKAHADGRRVRFWASPDVPAVWSALAAAKVDLINTDDLAGLNRFLQSLDRPHVQ